MEQCSICLESLDDGGVVALLDDWGRVELTADGVYVTLPEDLIGSGQLSGLLTEPPAALLVDQCAEASPLQPVAGAEVLFEMSELDVASCEHPRWGSAPLACANISAWLAELPCDDATLDAAEAYCSSQLSSACDASEPAWQKECVVDYCAGLGNRSACGISEACEKTQPPAPPPKAPIGAEFPEDGKGGRSTSDAGKKVIAAAMTPSSAPKDGFCCGASSSLELSLSDMWPALRGCRCSRRLEPSCSRFSEFTWCEKKCQNWFCHWNRLAGSGSFARSQVLSN